MPSVSDVSLEDNSQLFLDALKSMKPQVLTAIGETAEGHAKKVLTDTVYSQIDLPYQLTGELRNSISHAEDDDSVYIGTNVIYAKGIETGSHRKAGAVKFLESACTEHSDEYKGIVEEAMRVAGET